MFAWCREESNREETSGHREHVTIVVSDVTPLSLSFFILFGCALGLRRLLNCCSCDAWERSIGSIHTHSHRQTFMLSLARPGFVGVRKSSWPSSGRIAPVPRRAYVPRRVRSSVVRAVAPAAVAAPSAAPVVSTWFLGALSLLSGKHLEETFMALPLNVALREALILILLAIFLATCGVRVVRRADEWMKHLFSAALSVSRL